MCNNNNLSFHDQIKREIALACNKLGFQAKEEYRGNGWRADVFVKANDRKCAFEIQTSPQTLSKTLERQEKYNRDDIIGCWLFEKEPTRQKYERENLPLFKINKTEDGIYVSLKNRKTLSLNAFVADYLQGKISFRKTLNPLPMVDIAFIDMPCWKCAAENHIYFVAPFKSACNTKIHFDEAMWESDKLVFHPEITKKVKEYTNSENGRRLKIGEIKERYSGTVGDAYLSFGCSECDSIFGDWFVRNAIMASQYEEDVDRISFEVDFDLKLTQHIPHWCHPGDDKFCEDN